jgi:hypothetical protein
MTKTPSHLLFLGRLKAIAINIALMAKRYDLDARLGSISERTYPRGLPKERRNLGTLSLRQLLAPAELRAERFRTSPHSWNSGTLKVVEFSFA